jgi:hypothetical protein
MQENNTTTIQSKSFAEIHLHLTKKSHSETLVVIPSTKRNAKMPKKVFLQQVRHTILANNPKNSANFRPH